MSVLIGEYHSLWRLFLSQTKKKLVQALFMRRRETLNVSLYFLLLTTTGATEKGREKQKEISTLAWGALPMYLVLCESLSKLSPGIASFSHKSKQVNNCSLLKPGEKSNSRNHKCIYIYKGEVPFGWNCVLGGTTIWPKGHFTIWD